MIEIFEDFKKKYKEFGEQFIFDNYKLPRGIYIKVNADLSIDYDNIVQVVKKDDIVGSGENIDWFKSRCLISQPITLNKIIDTSEKKYYSINPFSLIFKRENLPDRTDHFGRNTIKKLLAIGTDFKGLTADELQPNKLNNILSHAKTDEEKERALYIRKLIYKVTIEQHFNKILGNEKVESNEKEKDFCNRFLNYTIEHGEDFVNIAKANKLKNGDWLFIFADMPVKAYEKYYNIYMEDKIFLNNHYNTTIDGAIYGPLNYSNTLNPDKPMLLMRSTNFQVPFRLSYDDAILFHKMKLLNMMDSDKYYIKRKDLNTITTFDVIPSRHSNLTFHDYKILQVEYKDIPIEGEAKTRLNRMDIEKEFNENFCAGKLADLYKIDEAGDIKSPREAFLKKIDDKRIISILINTRDIYEKYFRNEYDFDISKSAERYMDLIFNYKFKHSDNILNRNLIDNKKLSVLWDKKTSMIAFLSQRKEYINMPRTIQQLFEISIDKLSRWKDGLFSIEDDELFYFLCGQAAAYIMSKSRTSNKCGRLLDPFRDARNVFQLKEALRKKNRTYSFALNLNTPFDRVYQAIMNYIPKTEYASYNKHIVEAGLIGNNVFYMKIKKND